MQDKQTGPEKDHAEQAQEAKHHEHVYTILIAQSFLGHDDVNAIHDGAAKCHDVTDSHLGSGLLRK